MISWQPSYSSGRAWFREITKKLLFDRDRAGAGATAEEPSGEAVGTAVGGPAQKGETEEVSAEK